MNKLGVEWLGQVCVVGKNRVPLHEFQRRRVFWRRHWE